MEFLESGHTKINLPIFLKQELSTTTVRFTLIFLFVIFEYLDILWNIKYHVYTLCY